MRAWGRVSTRVPVLAPIPIQICGQLPMPRPIPNNAGIYLPNVGIFCGCPLGLSPIVVSGTITTVTHECRRTMGHVIFLVMLPSDLSALVKKTKSSRFALDPTIF